MNSSLRATILSKYSIAIAICCSVFFLRSAAQQTASLLKNERGISASLKTFVRDGSVYDIDQIAISKLFADKPSKLILKFHFENHDWQVALQKNDIFSTGFFVMDAEGKRVPYNKDEALYYRGYIKGNKKTFAAVSILPHEIVAALADEKGNINIGKLGHDSASDIFTEHIIYRDRDVINPQPFECGTVGDNNPLPEFNSNTPASTTAVVNAEPIDMYFEADYRSYQNNGSNISNTVNWVTSLFNIVNTLYTNDSVNIRVNAIKVWNVADPYVSLATPTDVLYAFGPRLAANNFFPGDLAHFLSQRLLGGGVAWLTALCSSTSGRTAVSGSLGNSATPLPAYSWNANVITHEIGHNIASPHTHSCSWPGGAIDNCYTPEGSCSQGPAPVNGGTIMSYCHLTSYGMNLMNGFGPLPGALIRNTLRNTNCIYPRVSFSAGSVSVKEEDADTSDDGCFRYKLVTAYVGLNYHASQPVNVTLQPSVIVPTMLIGDKQDLAFTTPLSFTLTDSVPQPVVMKVYDDAVVEGAEWVTIYLNIAANGTNAVIGGYGSCQVQITSDDYAPESNFKQTLYAENFDNIVTGLGNLSETVTYGNSSPNRWKIGSTGDASMPGKGAFISNNVSTPGYSGSVATDSTVTRLFTPMVTTAGFSNLRLKYVYKCNGDGTLLPNGNPTDFGRVYWGISAGSVGGIMKDYIYGRPGRARETVVIGVGNSPQQYCFEWNNNSTGVSNPPFVIDSISVVGTSAGLSTIQSASDAFNSQQLYFGPNQTIYFYNPSTFGIMASLTNNSNFDFGCTKIDIIRTGNGVSTAWGNSALQSIASKCFKVTTSNSDPSATYDLKLYYTATEINNWANATGGNIEDALVVKTTGNITQTPPVTAPEFSNTNSVVNYGNTDKAVIGRFSGSGTFSIARMNIPANKCTGSAQKFSANETGLSYQWQVDDGTGYVDVINNTVYSGAATDTLRLTNPPGPWSGYKYRCNITNNQGSHFGMEYILRFQSQWLGSAGTAWETPGNWSCGVIPDQYTDVYIKNAVSFYPTVNANTQVRSLKAGTGANVTVKTGVNLNILK